LEFFGASLSFLVLSFSKSLLRRRGGRKKATMLTQSGIKLAVHLMTNQFGNVVAVTLCLSLNLHIYLFLCLHFMIFVSKFYAESV
jgi:hypothetical protein